MRVLRDQAGLNDPSELRLSGSGPASSVAVLAKSGFMSGDNSDPARQAVLHARISANIDTEGDAIDTAARAVGDRAYTETKNGSIASIAFAGELARLRSWFDPFSPTPKKGYLVGESSPKEIPERRQTPRLRTRVDPCPDPGSADRPPEVEPQPLSAPPTEARRGPASPHIATKPTARSRRARRPPPRC